jgi:hypothetical protein
MFNRRSLIGMTAAGSLLLAGSAFAQGQAIVGISTVTTYSADAKITAVDPTARTVTLTYGNGATSVRKVGATVANFAQTRVGDMVSVGLEDRLTFVLSGPNTPTPSNRDVSVTVAAGGGQSVAGASVSKSVNTWLVTGVNQSAKTISLVNPAGGEVRTYNVTTPEGQAQLPRVKSGDSLTVIDANFTVVSITPKA